MLRIGEAARRTMKLIAVRSRTFMALANILWLRCVMLHCSG